VREPSWCDDVVIIASLPLGVVAALDEELARPVFVEVGSECSTVWSARHGAWCAREVHLLRCTCLRVMANSQKLIVRLVHHAGLDPGSGLALHGVAPASYLITSDDTMWRWVVSSLMCVLVRCIPLAVETLSGAWLYRRA
jgi:hypothetical protein